MTKPRMMVLPPLGSGALEQTAANRLIVATAMGARPARRKRKSASSRKRSSSSSSRKRKSASSRKRASSKRPKRLVKGSAAAKRYMAKLRRMRKR